MSTPTDYLTIVDRYTRAYIHSLLLKEEELMSRTSPIIIEEDVLRSKQSSVSSLPREDDHSTSDSAPTVPLESVVPPSMVPPSLGGSSNSSGFALSPIPEDRVSSPPASPGLDLGPSPDSGVDIRAASDALRPITANGRLRGKNFFLTAPRCTIAPESALEKCRSVLGNHVKSAIFVRERHSDGTFHLHGSVCLEKRMYLAPDITDQIFGKHANIQVSLDDSDAAVFTDVLQHRNLTDFALYMFNASYCDILTVLEEIADVSSDESE